MTLPGLTQTEVDGALGVLPPSSGLLHAVIGISSIGTVDAPATYGKVSDLVAAFGVGPMVEAAARHIELTGNPVVVAKTGGTTAATTSVPALAGTGTSVPTADGTNAPLDDYQVAIKIVNGGTRGTTGITYQTSVDGGRTYGPTTALLTAVIIAITGTGVVIALGAGTLVAGDVITCVTTAKAPNSAELGTAIDALKVSTVAWELCHIATPISATLFDTIETKWAGLPAAGKFRAWMGNARIPNEGESEATYLASLSTAFSAAKSSVFGGLCAGAAQIVSSVSGRLYRRPVSFIVASREAAVSQEVNIADLNLGALTGVSLRDANGNLLYHDEAASPGLDDARFTTLRTWEGYAGVYVTRSRIFSTEGSDFSIMPLRRVMNLARAATRAYLLRRVNRAILVDSGTGFILEEEALEIEAGGRAAMSAVLSGAPKASGWTFVVSRNENLLSTKKLTVTDRVIPLAYVEFIEESVGFTNPALRVVAA